MKSSAGRARYRHIGAVYDALSLERWLYGRPRRRLHEMIGPQPGATIVDAGCGTGLNFDGLVRLVGPTGRVIGIDASPSMLAAAARRTQRSGWDNITIIEADVAELTTALCISGVQISAIDVLVASFVVSTLRDRTPFWRAVDGIVASRPGVLVALADTGPADAARRLPGIALNVFAALGGNQRQAQPWNELAKRAPDVVTEQHWGGHVRLSLGRCNQHPLQVPPVEPLQ